MRFLLHVGQSKTGTSAIQAFLTLNRQSLIAQGILYPSLQTGALSVDLGNHNAFADALSGLSRYPFLSAEEYMRSFRAEAERNNCHTVLLSAEHFFGGEPRIWDIEAPDRYLPLYRAKLRRLRALIGGDPVEVIVYLRPIRDWLASAVGQTVRTERLISKKRIYQDDRQFLAMAAPVLDYCGLLDAWAEDVKPGKLTIVPYSRSQLVRGSSIADFLSRIGLEDFAFEFGSEDLQINSSLTREWLEVKKRLNRTDRSKTSERVAIRCLEDLSRTSAYSATYQLDRAIDAEVAILQEAQNIALQRKFGITLGSKPGKPDDGEAITPEQVSAFERDFHREVRRPKYRLLYVDLLVRAILRRHLPLLHGAAHQLKKLYRRRKYRNS